MCTVDEQQQILYMQVRLVREAAEKWGESLKSAVQKFSRYGLLTYIADCYELLHVQGDAAILEELEACIRKRGE